MKKILLLFAVLFANPMLSQKTAYIPQYILDNSTPEGAQFTWSKTAQSANFTLIWGNTVGGNPSTYPGDLNFNPTIILATMESIYSAYKTYGFIDDADGTNLALYKIPIVMLNTWGSGIAEGWAYGGQVDGLIGAFWAHPLAMQTGNVAAHELAHSIQAQIVIDYRNTNGFGPVWNYAGIFWETHANFMRNLLYPQDVTAWGMDVYHVETLGDWKNAYESYHWLFAVMENDGIGMINSLWKESLANEYPLQAYKRLGGYTQQDFNTVMYNYAKRMATFDFENVGTFLRQYRAADLTNYFPSIQSIHTILRQIPGDEGRYEVPVEIAPEEYAYNVIPLYPDESCSVIVKFKGHTELNPHAGWRYGFVAAHPDGTVSRYSPVYSENTSEIAFALEGDEIKMYLVVMGAPFDNIQINPNNDTWKGYPKHFRYPYELNITGAVPEGFQPASDFRSQLKNNGHLHSNGGGWVQNSASVAASVYVAPTAIVLGNAVLTGNVRIENTALVRNAVIGNNVKVTDNAFISGGFYNGNAIISDQSFAENLTMSENAKLTMRARVTTYVLSGTIEVGGDVVVYNASGDCDNGVYYRMTNYYEDNLLQCDGRTANHPDNLDVNSTYAVFAATEMDMVCNCASFPSCLTLDVDNFETQQSHLFPNPATDAITFSSDLQIMGIVIYDCLGKTILTENALAPSVSINIGHLENGMYFVKAELENGNVVSTKFIKN